MKNKLDARLIGFITTFENITGAHVKNAFFDDNKRLVFIVREGDAGKAIGRKGMTIAKVSRLIRTPIKIIEHHSDVIEFVKSIIDPLKGDHYELTDHTLVIRANKKTVRAALIGRQRSHLKHINAIVKHYFPVTVTIA